ncbi:2-amino-4-hydroxy-6-hydroxymethyldihydropteridine diphosphokinase [Sediminibacillus dalangtanensis]|uniref:2-amino-4-hydroxy-6-hydroxymethyldihydropteridine diphosphokinase n=1 Tax=Sediminibacillus dalangtanensis TaxID=2729421 RepID=A0ABX7VYT3_9BACI|nr:2-amino-4-hydroxy-6-hydroxymethyldihydropteridine diphosphokinase [Sediminibacillus dalangtanensis]QTN01290.1 2-amino-4-hydroxy-6-hydroxymethyldihydropteridine diphosphokinase [Sediminibacillus dalangtanensis]
MNTAYVGLGSNIPPRENYLTEAIQALGDHKQILVTKKSFIYETLPVGYTNQDNFLNMVVEIHTNLSACELLAYCQFIEADKGRKREVRWGPRTLDLDILLYNQENIRTEQLAVPHPRMHERAFVLIPLQDVNPDAVIPTQNKSVSTILDGLPTTEKKGVTRWLGKNGEEE